MPLLKPLFKITVTDGQEDRNNQLEGYKLPLCPKIKEYVYSVYKIKYHGFSLIFINADRMQNNSLPKQQELAVPWDMNQPLPRL